MALKINDLLMGICIASGLTFAIAMLVPKEYWFIIWALLVIIPFLIFQIMYHVIDSIRKRGK